MRSNSESQGLLACFPLPCMHMKDEDITEVLTEDLDEEVLKMMPLWFRRLKEAYARRKLCGSQ